MLCYSLKAKMDTIQKVPLYAKTALIFTSIFAFVFTLHIGEEIIVPLLYAVIISIVLNPFVNFLVSKNISRIWAISIAVGLAIFSVCLLLLTVSSQLAVFSEIYPLLKVKFTAAGEQLTHWISGTFGIRQSEISSWISKAESEAINSFAIGERIAEAGQFFVIVMLFPVYLFMILFYKTLLLEFIRQIFREEHHTAVAEVLINSKVIIQSYLSGLFLEMLIIAVLNSAGLLLIGIDYAIILGVTGAIVNIIPYIGGLIAILIPLIIAFATTDSLSYPILVLAVYSIIQFIDNHFIIPKIVAGRVKVNALVSVIVILIGSALWGIPGIFLSIPLTAIIKVICDHTVSLKPWGFLLGDVIPAGTGFSTTKKFSDNQ